MVASGDTPKPWLPARNSPESFSRTRRNLLSYCDAGDASDLDVLADGGDVLGQQLANGLLVVLDVRLVEQHDLGEELVDPSFDDALDHILRLAFGLRFPAQALTLGYYFGCRHLLAVHVSRVSHRHVNGQFLRQRLEVLVARDEVG